MNTCLKYILGFLLGSWLFTGCHYADMLEFNDIPRVSFVGVDKNGSDTYDPTTLGAPAGQPLKVSLKSVPVGGWPEAEVSFLNPYVIEDSAYRAILKVVVNRPAERHKEYKADLVFDYANSDVAEGIDTLRHYELTITDEVTLDMLGLYEGDWENYIAPYLGPYSENKARFMIMTLKMMNLSILTYGPGYINRYKPQLVEALEYYNTMNPDNHLKDENGNLISFDPA